MGIEERPGAGGTSDPAALREAAQRRALRALVVVQVLGGAGLAAGVSVGALLAEELLGSRSVAGLPAGLFTTGSAATAVGVGALSQRRGRRVGLTAGFAVGAAGGAGVVAAAIAEHVPLLLVSLALYGAGTATNLQCRYAATDLADPSRRGRAISTVLVATTVGAVAGPNLLSWTGDLAESIGWPRLAGPFALAAAAYGLAGLAVAVLLRPDPLLTARRLAELEAVAGDATGSGAASVTAAAGTGAGASSDPAGRRRALVLAASGMVVAQAVMVGVMSMTPVHLEDHHHGLGAVGLIIGLHVGAMYLPSPLTGRLVDTLPSGVVPTAGAVVLVAAALVAAAAGASAPMLAVALVLLGIGWNLSLVGGTAMVTELTTVDDRARTQGAVDLGIALAGATGGLASGPVLAATGYRTLGLVAAALAGAAALTSARRNRLAAAGAGT